jgi:shikimate 5-dehydrogenase
MIRLGLIGRNITHSLSPTIYKEILDVPFAYDLIDCQNPKDLPELAQLKNKYLGINITAPYKKYYLNDLKLLEKFSAINCLSFVRNQIEACNTDILATIEIVRDFTRKYQFSNFIILGDGAMAEIVAGVFNKSNIDYLQITRKNHAGNFSELNLSDKRGLSFVVNTCSRDYLFNGKLNQETVFWDMNYGMPNSNFISNQCLSYKDGYELLRKQAIHAALFWGLPLKSK